MNLAGQFFILSATGARKKSGNGELLSETLGELQAILKITGILLSKIFNFKLDSKNMLELVDGMIRICSKLAMVDLLILSLWLISHYGAS